jgi:hypothetical protein
VPLKLKETKTDHRGEELPKDMAALVREDSAEIVGYRVRWREEDKDGILRRPSEAFPARKHGSLDAALDRAHEFRGRALETIRIESSVPRPDPWLSRTLNDVLQEWIENRGPQVSYDYAKRVVKAWGNHVEHRPVARARLERISADEGIFVRFQDELVRAGLKPWLRYEILKDFRAVTRWGRKRHPAAIKVDVGGLIELPKIKKTRLIFAADAVTLERLIEAVLNRPSRDDLLTLRDAAFLAAMGFTIATRPSEWRLSATWDSLHAPTPVGGLGSVELQKEAGLAVEDVVGGLKTGAHVALMLANAYDRIIAYRDALEERFGPQPGHGLIFQVIDESDGPLWFPDPDGGPAIPLAWSTNQYNQWVKRVFSVAREIAAGAPDTPAGVAEMEFYDCRHTAISMACHSTLVMGPHGMNLHPLSAWSSHDIATLERYYRHIIARYVGLPPIVIEEECRAARRQVETEPFIPAAPYISPQQVSQRKYRARKRKSSSTFAGELVAA